MITVMHLSLNYDYSYALTTDLWLQLCICHWIMITVMHLPLNYDYSYAFATELW